MIRIACIGSREIDDNLRILMENIGEEIAKRNWFVASGNAAGSDGAYAAGANKINPKKVILYLPWATYNKEQIVNGNWVAWKFNAEDEEKWAEIAKLHHGGWHKLSQGAQKMMIRNAGILNKADACIAYLNPNKSWGGGTGHGASIANSLGIPLFKITKETTFEEVVEWLDNLINTND